MGQLAGRIPRPRRPEGNLCLPSIRPDTTPKIDTCSNIPKARRPKGSLQHRATPTHTSTPPIPPLHSHPANYLFSNRLPHALHYPPHPPRNLPLPPRPLLLQHPTRSNSRPLWHNLPHAILPLNHPACRRPLHSCRRPLRLRLPDPPVPTSRASWVGDSHSEWGVGSRASEPVSRNLRDASYSCEYRGSAEFLDQWDVEEYCASCWLYGFRFF